MPATAEVDENPGFWFFFFLRILFLKPSEISHLIKWAFCTIPGGSQTNHPVSELLRTWSPLHLELVRSWVRFAPQGKMSTTLPANLTTSWTFSKSPEGGHCEQLLTRHHPVLQGEFPLGGRRAKNRTVFQKKKNWKQLPELGLCPESCRKRPQTSWSPAASPGLFPGPLQVSYPRERAGLPASWGGPISPAPSLKDIRLCWSKSDVFVVELQAKLLYFWSFLLFTLTARSSKQSYSVSEVLMAKTRVISSRMLPLFLHSSISLLLITPHSQSNK